MSTKTQARKNLIASAKRKLLNQALKSRIKTEIKKARQVATSADAQSDIRVAQSLLDRAVTKGVLHKRQAARRKSRLAKALKGKQNEQTS
jgi:small subunit ribosomal protein S20